MSFRMVCAILVTSLALGGCRDSGGSGGSSSSSPPDLQPDAKAPLSSMVAVVLADAGNTVATDISALVRARVDQFARGTLPGGVTFPLPPSLVDEFRALASLTPSVAASWLQPLTSAGGATSPRYGANNDYIAYFGDGWDADWVGDVVASPPHWSGSGAAGWVWVNHEGVAGLQPATTHAPTGEHLTLARFLKLGGVLKNDVQAPLWQQADLDTYIRHFKRQHGGSWFRVTLDPNTRKWRLIPHDDARRYGATSRTQLKVTGHALHEADHEDDGTPLPAGVVAGILADCAGRKTPWGTVLTAEENVAGAYGDCELGWTIDQRMIRGVGIDPGSNVSFEHRPSPSGFFGRISSANERHNRDVYGYVVEMDPGLAPERYYRSADEQGDGRGHRKIGSMGRARWESAAVAVGPDWRLIPAEPVALYGGSDRPSGRIYKLVSRRPYTAGMTRAQVRALLDDADLYVAHFAGLDNRTGIDLLATGAPPTEASPGTGRWIRLSVDSTDVAPNATGLGAPTKTVGAALKDVNWNGIGGFPTDNDVRLALFTASNKIGVMELNRPEDVEWNPADPSGKPRLYVAFTSHLKQVALSQAGVLYDPDLQPQIAPRRVDPLGSIFALEELSPTRPARSTGFTYRLVFRGSAERGLLDASNPDNIAIDRRGGVWFSTDLNAVINGASDALFYLDLDPTHQSGQPGIVTQTYQRAIRIASMPLDAEATGPEFAPDMKTIFVNVQHPGSASASQWPQPR